MLNLYSFINILIELKRVLIDSIRLLSIDRFGICLGIDNKKYYSGYNNKNWLVNLSNTLFSQGGE